MSTVVARPGVEPVAASRPASAPPLGRWLGVVIAAAAGSVVAGPPGALGGAVAAAVWPRVVARRRRARLVQRLGSDVAVLFELAARTVRSGVAPRDALVIVTQDRPGPAADLVLETFGGPSPVSGAPGRRSGGPADVVAAVAAMVGGVAGGTARGLEAGAMILRERERARDELRAGIAQARTSAMLLTGAPVVFALICCVAVPGGAGALLGHPVAIAAIAVGVLLELAGAWWARRLISSVEASAS